MTTTPITHASTVPSKLIVALKRVAVTFGFTLPIFAAAALWFAIGSSEANQFNGSFWLGNIGPLAFLIAIFCSLWGSHSSTGNKLGPIIVIAGWLGIFFLGYFGTVAIVIVTTGQFLIGSYGWGVLGCVAFLAAVGLNYLNAFVFSKITK